MTIWPWLAVAGFGALHGLSPTGGWLLVADAGLRTRGRAGSTTSRALLALAGGHAAAIVLTVATVMAFGALPDRDAARGLAGLWLVGIALHRACPTGRCADRANGDDAPAPRAGGAGLMLWACLMAVAQGAGLMLLPTVVPMCLGNGSTREIGASGSIALLLAAVLLHLVAMIATTAAMAAGARRGLDALDGRAGPVTLRSIGVIALATLGCAVLLLH